MSTSLSVVMPVYNEAPFLPETIEALVAAVDESGFDAEVVLVDDGSTDGSAAVVRVASDGRAGSAPGFCSCPSARSLLYAYAEKRGRCVLYDDVRLAHLPRFPGSCSSGGTWRRVERPLR